MDLLSQLDNITKHVHGLDSRRIRQFVQLVEGGNKLIRLFEELALFRRGEHDERKNHSLEKLIDVGLQGSPQSSLFYSMASDAQQID